MSTQRMNPEIKAKWVAALRSGEYPQAKGRLRCEDGFCCLGVLCDLVAPEGWTKTEDDGSVFWEHERQVELPKKELIQALGFTHVPYVEIFGMRATLDEHNDGAESLGVPNRTFAEIADAIEEQL